MVREIDAIASRAEQQLEDHHSQLDGRYAIQFFRKFLSAANLTIEADWNTDMEAAPRVDLKPIQLMANGEALAGVWFEGNWIDHFSDIIVNPTAWKPLNPPGEG